MAESLSEFKRERSEKELLALMGQVSTLSIGILTIDLPSDVYNYVVMLRFRAVVSLSKMSKLQTTIENQLQQKGAGP